MPAISGNNNARNHIRDTFNDKIKKRKLIDEQVLTMSYDINYTNRITEILKYISNITDRDIFIMDARFNYGWEKITKKMVKGSSRIYKDSMDEEKRFLTIKGRLMSNPALQEQYFSTFQQKLSNSNLFYSIEVIDVLGELAKSGARLRFTLRCEF